MKIVFFKNITFKSELACSLSMYHEYFFNKRKAPQAVR